MRLTYIGTALATALLFSLTGCSSTAESNLAGSWTGVDSDGTEAEVLFQNGKKLKITSGDQTFTADWDSKSCDSPMELEIYPKGEERGYIPMLAEIARDGSLTLTAGSELKYQPTQVAKSLDGFSAKLTRSH